MADVSVDPECKDPKELLGQGIRAYVLQDYEVAVTALSKASELLVAQYNDDMHESLGEVYLYYGKSLLGLSREQNEALGDAVPKNSAEDSEDDEEPDQNEGELETEESEENKTEKNSASKPELSQPKGSGDSDPGPSSSKNGASETTEEQQNGEEDASDLQLAWEVLELAKKIFQKQDDKKSIAETLVLLGEVSLENENFQSAIDDIKQGLEIQQELLSKDSRIVAETLYKLGMAYSTNSQIDEAIASFNKSLDYLKLRIENLEKDKSTLQEEEIEELKGLIPNIEDKIADMNVYKEEAHRKLVEAITGPTKATQDGPSSSKQASDISHLVKRKRKLDEEDETVSEESPAKKPAV